MQHNFFFAESLEHSCYNYKVFWLIPKESVRAGKCREKNSQCKMTGVGVWGGAPATGGKGIWGQSPQRLVIFIIFEGK